MSWSSQWSLSFWSSHQYPICIPLHPHSCYMTRSLHALAIESVFCCYKIDGLPW
jgi:hypothetical protein